MKYILKCKPLKIIITPYILAKISDDFYKAAESYKQTSFSLAKYSMYLSSIERGLKAAILSKECTSKRKDFLKDKISHNLEKAVKEFESFFSNILSNEDKKNIKKVNKLYYEKGFDYFSDKMLSEMTQGYKNLPELKIIREISQKVNQFVIENKYFNI